MRASGGVTRVQSIGSKRWDPIYAESVLSLACWVDVRSMAEGGGIAGSRVGVESKELESEIGAASEWDRRGSLASCDRR